MRGGSGCGVSANKYSCADGAQINFGDLTSYLPYGQICSSGTKIFATLFKNEAFKG
jgi:hypothetical protein